MSIRTKWAIRYLTAAALVLPALAQTTVRVSSSSSGQGGTIDPDDPSISADGRYVVFRYRAYTNYPGIVPGLVPDSRYVLLRDMQLLSTSVVDVTMSGVPSGKVVPNSRPRISRDGRYVVFESDANDLVPGDTNGQPDVFVRDLVAGTTIRASVSSSGVQANTWSASPELSGDGRRVAFLSRADNLVPNDTNGPPHAPNGMDVFVRDLDTGTTTRVNVPTGGGEAISGGAVGKPSLSASGRYVAFSSEAPNLVPGDEVTHLDVYIHDRVALTTELVSTNAASERGNLGSFDPMINPDGRFVCFTSFANNLVPGDGNGAYDVFVKHLASGQITWSSADAVPTFFSDGPRHASISDDARYVAFSSGRADLVPGDTNEWVDVFVHDVALDVTTRVSLNSDGEQASASSSMPAINADGSKIAFASHASNLVADDPFLGGADIYRHDTTPDPGTAFCFGDGSLATACPCAPPDSVPSPSGAFDHGCANSFDASGAELDVAGTTAPDSVQFLAYVGPSYAGFGFLVKGNAQSASGVANGDGVRCVDGALVRFGGHNAATNGAGPGVWMYPNPVQPTPVSTATGQAAGASAYYQLIYRNVTAGFCSPGTTNWTNGVRIDWPL